MSNNSTLQPGVLEIYHNKYYYQFDFMATEPGKEPCYDSALLYTQVPFNPNEVDRLIKEIIKRPQANISILLRHDLSREAYLLRGGKLPVHF